jgi:hypothetical protein
MPGPFPGMDPFPENHWRDVYTRLTTYAADQLHDKLPGDLRVRIQEFAHLDEEDQPAQPWAPDVRMVESPREFPPRPLSADSSVTAAQPLIVPFVTEWTVRWMEIQDRQSGKFITSEFLSPGNKQTRSQRDAFRTKQKDLLQGSVNLVEIDLLGQGDWAMTVPKTEVPESHAYPYRVVVIRGHRPKFAEHFPTSLRAPLPVIKVPLRVSENDVLLELQPRVNSAWQRGDYADIDDSNASCPRFRPDDEAWIKERIAAWKQAQTT